MSAPSARSFTMSAQGGVLVAVRTTSGERRCRVVEPGAAMAVERLHRRALQLRQVALDAEAELGLQIAQMAVALGQRAEQIRLELDPDRRVDRVHPVLLVDRLAPHDRPARRSFFKKIKKAPGANDIDQLAVEAAALIDGHLGLGDGPAALHLDARAPQEVQDAHALVEAGLADLDELGGRALEPGRGHPAVVVPHRAEALPVAGIAPERPVLHRFDNFKLVVQSTFIPVSFTSFAHFWMSARRNLSKSSTDIPIGAAPCFAHASFTSGELTILLTSLLKRSSTGRGVPVGAMRPSHIVAS